MNNTTPLVAIERPSSNLTIVTIGPDLEFAFSYTTIVAFRAPTNPSASWIKSRNAWSQTTGKHLNQLPGEVIDHDKFNQRLAITVDSLGRIITDGATNYPPPVGEQWAGAAAEAFDPS